MDYEKKFEEFKKLVGELLNAIDTEMELGDYHFDATFASDEKCREYDEATDEVVFLREKVDKILGNAN